MIEVQFRRIGLLRVAAFVEGQLRDHIDMKQKKSNGWKATEVDAFIDGKPIGHIVRISNDAARCGEVWFPVPSGSRPVSGLRYATRHEAVAALYILTRPYACRGAGISWGGGRE